MEKLENILTWSVSRDRLFTDCKRAYYYHYYLSWGGWEFAASELTRKAYLLKNIQGIDAWIGDSVHKMIKWILENQIAGKEITQAQARARMKDMLVTGWRQSLAKAWEKNPKKHLNLFEHYYRRDLTPETLRQKITKAVECTDNFYAFGLMQEFSRLSKQDFLTIDELPKSLHPEYLQRAPITLCYRDVLSNPAPGALYTA